MIDPLLEYWPELTASAVAIISTARVIAVQFPRAAPYLKGLTAVIDIAILIGKAIKHAKTRTSQEGTDNQPENSTLERKAPHRPRPGH